MDLSGITDAFLARSMGGIFWFEWRWPTYLIALPLSVSGRKDSCSVRERLCILESYEEIGCTHGNANHAQKDCSSNTGGVATECVHGQENIKVAPTLELRSLSRDR